MDKILFTRINKFPDADYTNYVFSVPHSKLLEAKRARSCTRADLRFLEEFETKAHSKRTLKEAIRFIQIILQNTKENKNG